MKKNILKFIPITIIAATVFGSGVSVFAEYDPDKVIVEGEFATKAVVFKNSVIVDGDLIEDVETMIFDNHLMFPARKVFEKMGYEVEWNGNSNFVSLSKIPQFVTFKIGRDGYTFAKTAPMSVGQAPILVDGVTYVPFELLTEIMEIDAEVDSDNNIIINLEVFEETTEIDTEATTEEVFEESSEKAEGEEVSQAEANAKVISVDDNNILIEDDEKGEVMLVVGDETEIKYSDGSDAGIDNIGEKAKIYVEYGDAMTMSIPPVNNPISIVIFNK